MKNEKKKKWKKLNIFLYYLFDLDGTLSEIEELKSKA